MILCNIIVMLRKLEPQLEPEWSCVKKQGGSGTIYVLHHIYVAEMKMFVHNILIMLQKLEPEPGLEPE